MTEEMAALLANPNTSIELITDHTYTRTWIIVRTPSQTRTFEL
jgi:hypothetical protein